MPVAQRLGNDHRSSVRVSQISHIDNLLLIDGVSHCQANILIPQAGGLCTVLKRIDDQLVDSGRFHDGHVHILGILQSLDGRSRNDVGIDHVDLTS